MITTLSPAIKQSSTNWEILLASISDTDLDLLISANAKMQRGETVLTPRELEAYLRWQPHLDTLLAVRQNL
jgi:hypothetical protein